MNMNKITNEQNNIFCSATSLPVIAAPMFLISNPDMVMACCQNGVIGSFPALNQRSSDGLDDWIKEIKSGNKIFAEENPDKILVPFAVNLIVNKVNPRLKDDLQICIKHKVPIIITSLGINQYLIDAVHDYGGIVLHDVANVVHAKKAIDSGVDGLIAVCAGAGGHAGTLNPFAFIGELRSFYSGFIALAGCISKGSDILASQVMGADFAYMGTRFIATSEAGADNEYKEMIKDSGTNDVIYTDKISGISANFLKQSLAKSGIDINSPTNSDALDELLKNETKAWKNVWSAGQGVGAIKDALSIEELISNLTKEYKDALYRCNSASNSVN